MRHIQCSILLLICLTVLFASFVGAQEKQSSDLFVVIVNDKRGFIDRTGKIVIEPQWGGANEFFEGLAVVATYEDGYQEGYIDKTGKVVIPIKFDSASGFSEGLAAVGFGEFGLHNSGDHKTGFIDKTGNTVIKPKFRDAESFSEGLALVYNEGKYGYIDKTGKIVIPLQYEDASSFSEGLAWVKVGKKFGFIDRKGKIVIKPNFSLASSFEEGLASVVVGGKTIKLPDNAVEAKNFSEGLAAVGVKGDKDYTYNGYIDKTGNFVIKPQFSSSESFKEGLARIVLNPNFGFSKDGFGFIDKTGKIIMTFDYPSKYAMVNNFENGLAWVQKGGEDAFKNFREAKYGYIDKTGKVIWQPTK